MDEEKGDDSNKMEDTEGKEDEMKDATSNSMRVEASALVEMILDATTRHIDEFNIDCSVEDLLQVISASWEHLLPDGAILSLSYHGEQLSTSTRLEELGVTDNGRIVLQVTVQPSTSDLVITGSQPPPNTGRSHGHRMGSILCVEVDDDRGGKKEILVHIEHTGVAKPFLGGYRNRHTGLEYHNAAVQTLPKKRPDKGVETFQRDTQTVTLRNKYQQVMFDAATQMTRTGCTVSEMTDKLITPGHYETADEYHEKRLNKVLILQKHWRRWLAERYVSSLRAERQKRLEWEKQEAIRKQKEREERIKREFERRMNPKTKEDFDLLYHTLEMWRQDELKMINETSSGAARKAALCGLLEQEAQLIASVGRHKIVADVENKQKRIQSFLDTTAAPKHWIAHDGNVTQMDTPDTIRAQQLRDIYQSISREELNPTERLDVLLTLKQTVKEHDCRLTRDIVELIDREADLIMRAIPDPSLAGLRKRISTLFLQYCKTPLFNPEAAKHIRVPADPAMLRSNIYYCRSCCKYLPSTDFALPNNSRVVGHCRNCEELDNKARLRADYSTYRLMLRNIKQTEEDYNDSSHIIFLMQEMDLCYLVEHIWSAQSLLSGDQELAELALIRWNIQEQWSPWNCVLLSDDEAKAHLNLPDVETSYGAVLVQKVKHRHVLARNYFSKLPGMKDHMRHKVVELPLPRPTEKVMTSRQLVGDTGSNPINTL